MRDHNAMSDATAPHCNPEVLHAPGTCWACDLYPERQEQRAASRTPFTPADANGWPGNVAQPSASRAPHWVQMAPAEHVRPTLRQRLREALGL